MRQLLPKLTALFLVFFLLLAVTGTAFAAPRVANVSCSGLGCNGTWPDQTGCSSGATTVLSANIKNGSTTIGMVELRWSSTCQTNWTRVTSFIGTTGLVGQIERESGPDGGYLCFANPAPCAPSDVFIQSTQLFTQQVYAPNNNARATGWITQGGSTFKGCVANPGWSC